MNFSKSKKTLIITAVVFLSGAVIAFAHGGYDGNYGGSMMGYGHGYMMGNGNGPMMWGDGYGPHMRGGGYGWNLTEEQAQKLDQAREKFSTETQGLRDQIQEKRLAMRNEMVKEDPDSGKLADLQKELSQLESEFDQKALQHKLEMRKLFPDKDQGRGYGPGYGVGCWQQ